MRLATPQFGPLLETEDIMRGSCTLVIIVSSLACGRAAGSCGDLTFDGVTDLSDLAFLLTGFGRGNGGDLDGDADTDLSDLGILLAHFGDSSALPISVTELSAPPVIVAGSYFDIEFVIRSDAACWSSFYPPFEIYWSQDDTLSADDFLVYNLALNIVGIDPGETQEGGVDFVLAPCETPAGEGYVIVWMDYMGYFSTSASPSLVVNDCE